MLARAWSSATRGLQATNADSKLDRFLETLDDSDDVTDDEYDRIESAVEAVRAAF